MHMAHPKFPPVSAVGAHKGKRVFVDVAISLLLAGACSKSYIPIHEILLVILRMKDGCTGSQFTDVEIAETDDQPCDGKANCDNGIGLDSATTRY